MLIFTMSTMTKNNKKENKMKVTLLYGCKVGQPEYMEEILYECKGYTNQSELISKANEWAKINGYDRLRVYINDIGEKPNFKQAINIKKG